MNVYQRAHGLAEDNNPLFLGEKAVVMDAAARIKRINNDGTDPLIDELKHKRLRLFEDSRAK